MDFFNHLKTYLTDKQIADLSKALEEDSKHALLLNEEKMSKERLLEIYPNLVSTSNVSSKFEISFASTFASLCLQMAFPIG